MQEKQPPMPELIPRFAVADVMLWGRLVKMWATGKPYEGVPLMSVPRTVAELVAQCDSIKLKVTVPAHVTGLVVASYSPETLLIRLPPKDLLENTEAYLTDKRTLYPKLPVYELFEKFEDANGRIGEPHKLDFHAARVGDYSIAYCH